MLKNANTANGTKPVEPATDNGKKVETTSTLVPVKDPKSNEQKPAPSVSGKVISDLPPLDDRLHRLNQLFALQQKYNRYQSSLARLKAFELGKDDDSCTITFTDKSRNSFVTGNPELMPEFLNFLKQVITRRIKELEPLLKW